MRTGRNRPKILFYSVSFSLKLSYILSSNEIRYFGSSSSLRIDAITRAHRTGRGMCTKFLLENGKFWKYVEQ